MILIIPILSIPLEGLGLLPNIDIIPESFLILKWKKMMDPDTMFINLGDYFFLILIVSFRLLVKVGNYDFFRSRINRRSWVGL